MTMAYYREEEQVGWVDPDTLELFDLGLSDGEGLVRAFAAVGEWVDDGADCRFCGGHIGYGSSARVDDKTCCPTCYPNQTGKSFW